MEITGTPVMAVVKANAYGYGAVDVARIADEVGVDSFAVARVQEGLTLLENGIRRIFLFFMPFLRRKSMQQSAIFSIIVKRYRNAAEN